MEEGHTNLNNIIIMKQNVKKFNEFINENKIEEGMCVEGTRKFKLAKKQ